MLSCFISGFSETEMSSESKRVHLKQYNQMTVRKFRNIPGPLQTIIMLKKPYSVETV